MSHLTPMQWLIAFSAAILALQAMIPDHFPTDPVGWSRLVLGALGVVLGAITKSVLPQQAPPSQD